MAFPTNQGSVVTNPGGTGSSIVPTLPTHAANDEIEIWVTKTGNAAWSAPAGWAIARQVTSPGSASTATQGTLLYRRVLSTDTLPLSSPTCNLGATVTRHAVARTIRGTDIESVYLTPSWSAIGTGTGTANPIRPASVTTPAPEMFVTHYYCQRLATNAPEPTGYTQDQEVVTSGTLVTNVSQKNVADQNTALTNQDTSPTSGGRWAAVITCAPSIDYPYYRSGSQATATGTSVTPTKPTGTTNSDQRGNKDVMIATVEAAGTPDVSPQDTGLWQEILTWDGFTSGNGTQVKKYWCYATASPNMQFNRSTSGEISVCVTTYYNCHQTNPIGNTDADPRASSTTSTWDAVTRSSSRCVMTATCVADGTPSFTSPTGWVEVMDGLGITCSHQIFNVADVTGADSFTLSAANATRVGLVEIRNLTAPTITTVIPSTIALSITQFAPLLTLKVIPSVQPIALAMFAPIVVAGGGETIITPTTATLALSGLAPTLVSSVIPSAGGLSLSEFVPVLELKAIPSTATLTLSSLTPVLGLGVVPGTSSLALSEFAPALELKVIPSTPTLTISSFASAVQLSVTPSPIPLTLVSLAPGLEIRVVPSTVALTLNTLTPGLVIRVIPNTAVLTLNTFAPAIKTAMVPSAATLTIGVFSPSLGLGLVPQSTGLSLSAFAPTLGLSLIPQVTGLTLTTFAPSLGGETTVIPASATLNVTTFAVRLSETVTPITVSLSLTELAPQLATRITLSTQTLVSTLFIPELHAQLITQTASLTVMPFAPTVTMGGGQPVLVAPPTKPLFLTAFPANVLAFHVRSGISVGREVQSVRIAKENRTLNVS